MSTEKLSPLDQWLEGGNKLIGRIITSEDHRAQGPGFPNGALNRDVTQDGIRIFVDGEGDLNPLFRDPEYAKKTNYKCLIAPPNYLYTITYAQHGRGPSVPGVGGYYSGSDREYFRPICEGDKITYRVMCPSENKLMPSRFAGQKVQSLEKGDYYRQGADLIAGWSCYCMMTDLERVKEVHKYGHLDKMPKYTEKDLEEIYAAQDREEIRGAKPRYWEDVNVGDELTPVVRGPLSETESIAWMAGGHSHVLSDRLNRLFWAKNPLLKDDRLIGNRMRNFEAAHPRPAVAGQHPEAWRFILLTNWMGDDGFLWKFSDQIRMFTMWGDTTWVKGKVIKKYCDNEKYCVDIDIQNVVQTGTATIIGSATVILPSREHGPVVYPEPYPRVPFTNAIK